MHNFHFRVSFLATLLAFIVVVLGAYTRITDAGLGCPDWPGCYHQLIVPKTASDIQKAQQLYPNSPVQAEKAWAEMIHRYAAGSLVICVLILAGLAIRFRQRLETPKIVPFLLLGLIFFQAALGMWTVTLKLAPIVVMSHLLGGFSILSLLWWNTLRLWPTKHETRQINSEAKPENNCFHKIIKIGSFFALILLIIQIALGGWTSANYAALVCSDFPSCSSSFNFWPILNFSSAYTSTQAFFNLGLLPAAALMTIQMTHRFGALILSSYLVLLIALLFFKGHSFEKKIASIMGLLLLGQITLGILNVELRLPWIIAVSHNAMATMLLLTVITLLHNYYLSRKITL